MNDDQAKIQQELDSIQQELNTTGMSRRNFLDRLKGVGLGFGAVAIAGTAAQAHTNEGAVGLKTTNAALGKVVEDNQQQEVAEVEGEQNPQLAQYYYRPRYFYRRYRRFFYRRFFYRRYRRYYW